MKNILKRISCILYVIIMLFTIPTIFPFIADATQQTFEINCDIYEFGQKSSYNIDSSTPSETPDSSFRLGTLSINGDIVKQYDKNGITAYEISDNALFNLDYKYISTLKSAGEKSWHLIKDSDNEVNGIELSDDIDYGAIILQTSFDGSKWTSIKKSVNITKDISFNESQINNIQLANGCYYRIIVVFEIEKKTKDDNFLFVDTSDYSTKKIAEVYTFYASYKDTDAAPTGEKFYFYAGGKNSGYTTKTKKNNYAGSEKIDKKDPHYGWDLGCFCLSGYTDKGDDDDVYLKKVGDKVKLTFRLDQNIKKLNGKSDLVIESDKNGSDEKFKITEHNMKHGELIIQHTNSENVTEEIQYSDYLAALSYQGADTSIQLFEEGDYEVHLNYAITDTTLIDSNTYYQTAFKFKIRNANCMVYIFDSESGAELNNGDVTANGFRIDTAKSSYPKLQVKKEIMNNTNNGLIEDTRFNGAVSDGEIFTEEGIYTIKAFNRYDDKLEPAVKKIYVGSNNILAAYTRNIDSANPYTITQLTDMQNEGYIFNDNGEINSPDSVAIATIQSEVPTTESTQPYTDTATVTTIKSNSSDDSGKKSGALFIIIGISVLVAGGIIISMAIKIKGKKA